MTIGIGQSMGGSLTVVQQGRYHCYDGIGVLGYSAVHTHPPTAPGTPPLVLPWVPRDAMPSDGVFTNGPALAELDPADAAGRRGHGLGLPLRRRRPRRGAARPRGLPGSRRATCPPWGSATVPTTVALWCLAPGGVAPEAAAVRCPVLVALGERDVLVDPRGEARAYVSARSVDLFICPRMGHMHNFAGTRELFWRRIETWADWVRAARELMDLDLAEDLLSLLTLERVDRDLFRGRNANYGPRQTLYGGQVAAQCLLAAAATVEPDRLPHSLHGYFLRAGAATSPWSSRSTGTATGARSRPATSSRCRRATSSSP